MIDRESAEREWDQLIDDTFAADVPGAEVLTEEFVNHNHTMGRGHPNAGGAGYDPYPHAGKSFLVRAMHKFRENLRGAHEQGQMDRSAVKQRRATEKAWDEGMKVRSDRLTASRNKPKPPQKGFGYAGQTHPRELVGRFGRPKETQAAIDRMKLGDPATHTKRRQDSDGGGPPSRREWQGHKPLTKREKRKRARADYGERSIDTGLLASAVEEFLNRNHTPGRGHPNAGGTSGRTSFTDPKTGKKYPLYSVGQEPGSPGRQRAVERGRGVLRSARGLAGDTRAASQSFHERNHVGHGKPVARYETSLHDIADKPHPNTHTKYRTTRGGSPLPGKATQLEAAKARRRWRNARAS